LQRKSAILSGVAEAKGNADMNNRPRSHHTPPSSADYLEAWARDVVAAAGKRDARRLLASYRARADNRQLAKTHRNTAAERAKALEQYL
jgi:hypothetical protein